MGRAIVRDPQVFLFDEPLSNLDAKLRVAMRTEIKELHQRLKTTSVYVTHDQIEAMTMADQIVVMRDGLVEQRGQPLELYDRPGEPVRRRIHRLAGDELPAGHAAAQRRRRADRAVRRDVDRRAPTAWRGADGQKVLCGMRPEHLTMADGSKARLPRSSWSSPRAPKRRCSQARRRGRDGGVPRAPRVRAGRDDPPASGARARATCSMPRTGQVARLVRQHHPGGDRR